jgi:hypothetical protein
MRIRTNGDAIAQEFLKIINKDSKLNKTASLDEAADSSCKLPAELSGGDTTVALDNLEDESLSDDELGGLLSGSHDLGDESIVDQIDESFDSTVDSVEDSSKDLPKEASLSYLSPKGMKIMHGLGKIAASLRVKGEDFAADVVEATAMSISGDLKKEAAEKKSVVSNLQKVASKLDSSGDKFAGDLVRVTIENIIKK